MQSWGGTTGCTIAKMRHVILFGKIPTMPGLYGGLLGEGAGRGQGACARYKVAATQYMNTCLGAASVDLFPKFAWDANILFIEVPHTGC